MTTPIDGQAQTGATEVTDLVEPTDDQQPEVETQSAQQSDSEAELEALKAQIAELKSTLSGVQSQLPKNLVQNYPETEFFDDQEFEQIAQDPKEFRKVLNKAYQHAANSTEERLLKIIPQMAQQQVSTAMAIMDFRNQFYAENPDLASKKNEVSTAADGLIKKNPTWTMQKIAKEAAAIVRASMKPPTKAGLPSRAGTQGTPAAKPQLSDAEAERKRQMDAMVNALKPSGF